MKIWTPTPLDYDIRCVLLTTDYMPAKTIEYETLSGERKPNAGEYEIIYAN